VPLVWREFILALNPESKYKKSQVWARVGEAPTAVKKKKEF